MSSNFLLLNRLLTYFCRNPLVGYISAIVLGLSIGLWSLASIQYIYESQLTKSNKEANIAVDKNADEVNVFLPALYLNIEQTESDSKTLLKWELRQKEEALILANNEKKIALLKIKNLEKALAQLKNENSNLSTSYKMRLEDLSHMTKAVKMHQTIDEFRFNDVEEVLGKELK